MAVLVTAESVQKEGATWRYFVELTDEATGAKFVQSFFWPEEPGEDWKAEQKATFIAETEHNLELTANPLNRDRSEELWQEMRKILIAGVKYIRENQATLTEEEFLAWLHETFPNTLINVDNALRFMISEMGLSSFEDAKAIFVAMKFEEVD